MTFKQPTLHVSIMTLLLMFLLFTAGSLTWFNYSKNTEAAIEIADDLLVEVGEQASNRIRGLLLSTFHVADEVSELPYISEKPDFMSHPAQWFLAEKLESLPSLYSVYMGYADGDFYQVISLRGAPEILKEALIAPQDATLAVRKAFLREQDGRRVELWQFFNEERRIVGSRSMRSSEYDPRQRPWYQLAINKDDPIRTPFYIFTSTRSMGLTMAHRFDGKVPGVFGVDITLTELSDFFAEQAVGESGFVVMFDDDKLLTAHPDPEKTIKILESKGRTSTRVHLRDAGEPILTELADRLEDWNGQSSKYILELDGKAFLVHVTAMQDKLLQNQNLAIVAPLSDFTGEMDRTRRQSLLFAGVIILFAIPVAMYLSRKLSTPLRKLADEADNIRQFKLDSPIDVQSRIVEIANLTQTIKAMKKSLSSFGRYVPKTLVQQILLSKVDTKLGGDRKNTTLFFSDIADFTTISESMDAEELMIAVSEYLELVSSVIIENGGTIDKYIGDSIMAFWNAPVRQENHEIQACEAALLARHASEKLNTHWQEAGRSPLLTRFGLHTCEAIIGNVGSKDRMNYTAMGASVNLASRLEGLNKYYGTQILASEAVVEGAKSRFLFRSVGKVLPKGTATPVSVFELLGYMPGMCTEMAGVQDRQMQFVSTWETGYDAYQRQDFTAAAKIFGQCAADDPQDRLAAIMAERAQELATNPPSDGWDGVDVFKTK